MKNKKTILLGTMTTMAMPMLSIISCSSSGPKIPNKIKVLQTKHISESDSMPNYVVPTWTPAAKTALQKLHTLRGVFANGWEDSEDIVIDTINDYRFALKRLADGEKEALDDLKEILDNIPAFHDLLTNKNLSGFKKNAIDSFNDFLAGNLGQIMNSFQGHYADKNGITLAQMQNMKPLKADYAKFAFAQYRANQIDATGEFDDHDFKASNDKIKAGKVHGYASIPPIWERSAEGSESYAVLLNHKTNIARNTRLNIYDAFCINFELTVDHNDGTSTMGHRYNNLDPDANAVGWALAVERKQDKNQYIPTIIYSLGGMSKDLPFVKIVQKETNYTPYVLDNFDFSKVPASAKTSSATFVEYLKAHEANITNAENKTLKQYGFTYRVVEGPYVNTKKGPMTTMGGSSINETSSGYDVLGSGTQALFENKNS